MDSTVCRRGVPVVLVGTQLCRPGRASRAGPAGPRAARDVLAGRAARRSSAASASWPRAGPRAGVDRAVRREPGGMSTTGSPRKVMTSLPGPSTSRSRRPGRPTWRRRRETASTRPGSTTASWRYLLTRSSRSRAGPATCPASGTRPAGTCMPPVPAAARLGGFAPQATTAAPRSWMPTPGRRPKSSRQHSTSSILQGTGHPLHAGPLSGVAVRRAAAPPKVALARRGPADRRRARWWTRKQDTCCRAAGRPRPPGAVSHEPHAGAR